MPTSDTIPALCRDCLTEFDAPPVGRKRCPACGSPRILAHAELHDLSIAHMDCDAFYASVEKRDNPELRDRPVIIGGGKRGVVSTACYIARIHGVRSAMPMFQANKLCPEAVVVKPRMSVYVEASRQIREMMRELTPVVEPLSLDEAFLDLTGTARLHHASPAKSMATLIKRMQDELGLSGSVGLSHNKFLAKMASDFDKPRGYSIVGAAETMDLLAAKPVKLIWGVGKAMQTRLERDGIRSFADLRRRDRADLIATYGAMGDRLWHLARGQDKRSIQRNSAVKSISKETTFFDDISDVEKLDGYLWRLAEQVADRAKAKERSGRIVTLKVKQANHQALTRRLSLREPTQIAERIYDTARPLLDQVMHKAPFRLIGVGISELHTAAEADQFNDLLEQDQAAKAKAERATDAIRDRFGKDAIMKGRALR